MSDNNSKAKPRSGCFSLICRIIIVMILTTIIADCAVNGMPHTRDYDLKQFTFWVSMLLLLYVTCLISRMLRRKYTLKKLDKMDGHEFEYACADILKANGFKNVTVTKSTGDFGVDILAEKHREKYAIQCKCYSKTLGNKPIQEVIGGLAYYDCTIGAVMTNQYFTDGAIKLAEVNDIELWDRDVLSQMIKHTKNGDGYIDDDLPYEENGYEDEQEYIIDEDNEDMI